MPSGDGNGKTTRKRRSKIVATYDYCDENGDLLFQVVRYDPKDFRQRKRKPGGGWDWSVKGVRVVPYRLPELLAEPMRPTFVVEGEKDVHALSSIDVLATCNAGGSGKWTREHAQYVSGRHVIVIGDNDDPGRKHAEQVAGTSHGIARSVRIVKFPGLPPKGDVSDWIRFGGTKTELVRLAKSTPAWSPAVAVRKESPAADKPNPAPKWQPFPVDLLPYPIDDYVAIAAKCLSCNPAYIALPMLASLASSIGNSRIIRLRSTWTEPSILWCIAIGKSGCMKSPAWELATRFLVDRQNREFGDYAEKLDKYETDKALFDADYSEWKKNGRKNGEPPPDRAEKPTAVRYVCSDTTIEAVAVLLHENPRGLLLSRDELSGWFGSFDAFKSSVGGDAAHWLSTHRAGSMLVDRKTGKRIIHVPRAAMSITGTTQPQVLKAVLAGRTEDEEDAEHFINGMCARFMLAYPPTRAKKWVDGDIPVDLKDAVANVFDRLLDLEMTTNERDEPLPVEVGLTAAAHNRFVNFYDEHAQETARLSEDLAAAWSKLEGGAARLSLIVHLVRAAVGDADPDTVDDQSIETGIELSRWFADEAARIYSVIGGSADGPDARDKRARLRLVAWIRNRGGSVTVRDLRHGPREYRRGKAEKAELALQDLAKHGHGNIEIVPPGILGGRATTLFVLSDKTHGNTPPQKHAEKHGSGSGATLRSNSSETVEVVI